MKITTLEPFPVDPHADIVQQMLEMPVGAFIVARGDLYRIGGAATVDIMLRTGIGGFTILSHSAECFQHELTGKRYFYEQDAERWARRHLESGATLSIVDPNEDA